MQFTTRLLYEQIADHFVKVVWAHKIHGNKLKNLTIIIFILLVGML